MICLVELTPLMILYPCFCVMHGGQGKIMQNTDQGYTQVIKDTHRSGAQTTELLSLSVVGSECGILPAAAIKTPILFSIFLTPTGAPLHPSISHDKQDLTLSLLYRNLVRQNLKQAQQHETEPSKPSPDEGNTTGPSSRKYKGNSFLARRQKGDTWLRPSHTVPTKPEISQIHSPQLLEMEGQRRQFT